MKKLIQKLFINYNADMEPDINLEVVKEKLDVKALHYKASSKTLIRAMFSRQVLAFLCIIVSLFALQRFFIDGQAPKYEQIYNEIIIEYDNFTNNPILKTKVNKNTELLFFEASKEHNSYVIVVPVTTKKQYRIKLYENEDVILDLNMKDRVYDSFIVQKEHFNLELIVILNENVIYYENLILDLKHSK